MKKTWILTLFSGLLFSFFAQAETQLSCWNMYSKRGSRPVMKADIESGNQLVNVTFDFSDKIFESYFVDKEEDAGERWGHKPVYSKSFLRNPDEALEPELITSNRRVTYKGNNSYQFEFGRWSIDAPYIQQRGEYDADLILPTDLSNEFLSKFRIRVPSERSNAVVIFSPSRFSSQSGDNYLRMFCVSR